MVRLTVALVLAALAVSSARAEGVPLDEKVRFEKALEDKADAALLAVLGPGRAKTLVDASVDLTRVERFHLLPGGESRAGVPPSYERVSGFSPAVVKRLTVTLVVDRRMSAADKERSRELAGAALRLEAARGDRLTLLETDFASAWRSFRSPQGLAALGRGLLRLLLGVAALAVAALGFSAIARAVETRAAPAPQIIERAPAAPEPLPVVPPPAPAATPAAPGVVIDVRPEQVERLAALLEHQEPDNVALVLACLTPEARRSFLGRLAPEAKADAIARLAAVRFVDRPILEAIKTEIENRIGGAVGGLHEVCRIVDEAEPAAKRELLSALQRADPELAHFVRPRVLLFEDLSRLRAEDWHALTARVRLVDWAAAMQEAPPELAEQLRERLAPDTWAVIERERERKTAGHERVREAESAILEEASRLISAGRIKNPLELPEAPAADEEPPMRRRVAA